MSLIYIKELKKKKNLLRDRLIDAEWQCYNDLAENLRKQIQQIEKQIKDYEGK